MIEFMPLCLFAAAVLLALLAGFLRRGRSVFALLAALCAGAGLLSGLALGRGLEELLPPLALVCAAALAALVYGKGGADG